MNFSWTKPMLQFMHFHALTTSWIIHELHFMHCWCNCLICTSRNSHEVFMKFLHEVFMNCSRILHEVWLNIWQGMNWKVSQRISNVSLAITGKQQSVYVQSLNHRANISICATAVTDWNRLATEFIQEIQPVLESEDDENEQFVC